MRRKKILPFATTWMNLEGIILKETSQTEKDKHCMESLNRGILKKKSNSLKQRVEKMVARG